MAVIIYFGLSFLILLAGFTLTGVTFYHWWKEYQLKRGKESADVVATKPSSSSP